MALTGTLLEMLKHENELPFSGSVWAMPSDSKIEMPSELWLVITTRGADIVVFYRTSFGCVVKREL